MTNAEWMVKNGYKFSDIWCCNPNCNDDYDFLLNGKYIGTVTNFSAFATLERWLDMEHEGQEELKL